jgi:hypothetical protein
VLTNFGSFLAVQGETNAGIDLILEALAIQQKLRLPIDHTLDVLNQCGDPDKKWKLAASDVYMIIHSTANVLLNLPHLIDGWLTELDKTLAMVRQQNLNAEVEFIEAVKSIVRSKKLSQRTSAPLGGLHSGHPYAQQVEQLIDLLKQHDAEQYVRELTSLMEQAIEVSLDHPNDVEEFAQHISIIGLQAMMKGNLSFGTALMGIQEYLRGRTTANADPALDQDALNILQILVDQTEEIKRGRADEDSGDTT